MSENTREIVLRDIDRVADSLEKLVGLKMNELDSTYCAMIDGTNTTRIFWEWYAISKSDKDSKYDLLCRFARMLAAAWREKKYTLRYVLPESGGSSEMTPLDDLADKAAAAQLCTEATTPVTDWADDDPMTWYIRANAKSLSDGTMNVTYLEGENGFDLTGEEAPVYTFSLALWLKVWSDGSYNYKTWTTIQQSGAAPYPGDVGVDGKKRDLTWHPTFDGSYNSTGKLTSGVGGKPANRISAGSGIAKARLQSAYDALWGDTDTIWALHTWQLRHWNLENSGICEGCQSYNYTYTAAVSETGVRRVLVTTAQGANLQVGSNIMVGTNASTDRGAATSYSIADNATILSKETVYVNEVAYCALNLDTVGTFDVTAGTTQIITAPWSSGNTELLPGRKDGACHSLTAGQNPFRLQGVEFMTGAYVIGLDPLYDVTANATSGFDYHVYECRDATKQASSITADYVDTGIVVTGIASGWNYVKRFVKTVLGVLFPDMFGGSSTTYFKSAFYGPGSAGVRCPWRFGYLYSGGTAGLASEYGYSSPGSSLWHGRLRLSGSGKMRGEWAA